MNRPVTPSRRVPLLRAAPLRRGIQPMLATLVHALPANLSNWGFEYKWDGVRAIYYWDGRDYHIESRNQLDITHRYPELSPLAKSLGRRPAILDGEIVALDDQGRPSFELLTHRMHIEGAEKIARMVRQTPICYLIFDVLHLDKHPTMGLTYLERRRMLDSLELSGPSWRVSPVQLGRGKEMLESARSQAMEGIIAKRIDSPYEAGRRPGTWLKIKIIGRQEFVVGGWVPERGVDSSRIGSLLLGYYDDAGNLRLAGGVGTGFDDRWHRELTRRLHQIPSAASPFADPVHKSGAIFVKPRLVAEIEYRRWPRSGSLQQSAFKGIRSDKPPREVRDER